MRARIMLAWIGAASAAGCDLGMSPGGTGKDDPGAAAAAAEESTGIPECDAYLARMVQCMPQSAGSIPQMRAGYRTASANPAGRSAVASSCVQASAALANCKPAGGGAPPAAQGARPPPGPAALPAAPGQSPAPGVPQGAPAAEGARTPPPTPAEFNAVREVGVRGSSALGCETKMVREWLRISCRGKNDTGGTPTQVNVTRDGGAEVLKFAAGGVTSLLFRFVPGVHVEAVFSWSDKSHKLVSTWPRGAPEPTLKGAFEGAASPLDGKAGGDGSGGRRCGGAADCGGGQACCFSTGMAGPTCMAADCVDRHMTVCRTAAECGSMFNCVPHGGFKVCRPPGG